MRNHDDVQDQNMLRKSHNQRGWKTFGLSFYLLCSLPMSDALLERSRQENDNLTRSPIRKKRPVPSSKTRSAIRAERDLDDNWTKSKRMSEQASIVEHLLASHKNEFSDRLLAAMHVESEQSIVVPPDPVSSLVMYGVLTLVLSSAFLMPTLFVDSLWRLLWSVAPVLIPWLWIVRATSFKETAIMCLSAAVQLVPRQRFHRSPVFQKVLPLALDTLQKMILMEIWSRVWRTVGRTLTNTFRNMTSKQCDNKREQSLPNWLVTVHEFLDKSIRKGSQKAIIKTLELNVQAAVGVTLSSVFGTVAQYLEKTALQRILPFQMEDILITKESL